MLLLSTLHSSNQDMHSSLCAYIYLGSQVEARPLIPGHLLRYVAFPRAKKNLTRDGTHFCHHFCFL